MWFLGDDDLPRIETIAYMLAILRSDEADLLVFNFRVVDEHGRLSSAAQIRGADRDWDTSLRALIQRIGLINMLSGWSIIVARRSMLDVEQALAIMARSTIYSHCFWFLTCFANARVRFVARPLVSYRVFHSAGGWEKYTSERDIGYYFAWHLGIIRLYRYAVEAGLLRLVDIGSMFECRHDGTRYRAVDEICLKLVEQADVYVDTKSKRNLLTRKEFDEAFDFLVMTDLALQDILFKIKDIYECLWDGPQDDFSRYRQARTGVIQELEWRKRDLFEPFFVQYHHAYSVYRVADYWVGIRADSGHLHDGVFAQLYPRAIPPQILVESSWLALNQAIMAAPPMTEPVGPHPSVDLSLPPPPREDITPLLAVLEHRTQQLQAVYNSTSWALTKPLRQIVIVSRSGGRALRSGLQKLPLMHRTA